MFNEKSYPKFFYFLNIKNSYKNIVISNLLFWFYDFWKNDKIKISLEFFFSSNIFCKSKSLEACVEGVVSRGVC